jgi:hypothetical protein
MTAEDVLNTLARRSDIGQIRLNFRAVAKIEFGTVSGLGSVEAPFRVAIGGKRRYTALAALVEQYGGVIEPTKGQYPELARIVFELPETCERCAHLNHRWLPCDCVCHDGGEL